MGAGKHVEWARPMPGLRILRRGAAPVRRIQLYGQRCSGTHFATRTLEVNFGPSILTEDYGYKHWFMPRQMLVGPETLVLVVARGAFDWVRSLHRQPWHAHPDLKAMPFADFIRAKWHSYWDVECHGIAEDHPMLGTEMMHERHPETGERFANCIAKRTVKLRQWTGIPARAHNVALLSYETLMTDPEAVVAALAEATGLPTVPTFAAVTTYKGHGIKPFVPTVYPAMADNDAAHIARWLDPEVEALFDLPATIAPHETPAMRLQA